MARFLFASTPIEGHSSSPLSIMERLVAGGVVPGILAHQVAGELEATDARLRPGVRHGESTDQRADVERLAGDGLQNEEVERALEQVRRLWQELTPRTSTMIPRSSTIVSGLLFGNRPVCSRQ